MKLYGNQGDVKAFAGMLYGMNPKSVITYPAGENVEFGKGLFLKNDVVKTSKDTDGVFVGVSLFHQCEGGKYFKKDAVACMNDGNIYVSLVEGIESKDGEDAYVTDSGLFTNVSEGNEKVGKFKSEAKDGLAFVDLSK